MMRRSRRGSSIRDHYRYLKAMWLKGSKNSCLLRSFVKFTNFLPPLPLPKCNASFIPCSTQDAHQR